MSNFDLKVHNKKEEFGFPFSRIRGIQKLVNYVEKMFYTTLGSDPSDPESGCWLKTMIGQNYSSIEEVAEKIDREIKRVESYIVKKQLKLGNLLTADEQLKELVLVRIYEEEGAGDWSVRAEYKVINRADEAIDGTLFSEE